MGPLAARFIATHRLATVAAVFERSLYIEHDGDFLCLGAATIGNGPINAIVAADSLASWLDAATVGQRVAIRDGVVHAGRWRADGSQAVSWRPPAWPPFSPAGDVRAALARVRAMASEQATDGGLTSSVMDPPRSSCPATPLVRVAAPRIAALEGWIADRIAGRATAREGAPVDLLGLGPGLTPSGDDLLCGVLIALDAACAHAARASLSSAILMSAHAATTPLSAQFLAAAVEGLGSEALHQFIAHLISADLDRLPGSIATLGRIGHTSGWDALAGAVLAVGAFTAAQEHRPPRSP